MTFNFRILTPTFLVFLFMTVLFGRTLAQKNLIFDSQNKEINLKPYFEVVEDVNRSFTAEKLVNQKTLFKPISGFKPKSPTSDFWLITRVTSREQAEATIHFKNLSFAELYFMADTPNAKMMYREAGAFRPAAKITDGDSRFHFTIKLDQQIPYIILIKSRNRCF